MKVLKLKFFFLPFMVSSFLISFNTQGGPKEISKTQLNVDRVGDMVQLRFHRDENQWSYELDKSPNGNIITLIVPQLDLKSVKDLQSKKNFLFKKIETHKSLKNQTVLKIYLTDPRVETFNYWTQSPSYLLVDFFISDPEVIREIKDKWAMKKDLKNLKEKKIQKVKKLALDKNQKNKLKKGKKNKKRNIAFSEYQITQKEINQNHKKLNEKKIKNQKQKKENSLNLADLFKKIREKREKKLTDDLENRIIESRGNIYLRFPMFTLKNENLEILKKLKPEYKIKKSLSDENKQARKLINLYNIKKYYSFIKGKKIYQKMFPSSQYDKLLLYVEADTWMSLWKKTKKGEFYKKAMLLYKTIVERYPNSKIAERNLLYMGFLTQDNKNYFSSVKMLRRYLRKYPNSPLKNYVKIYLAESLTHLKNFSKARSILNNVIKNGDKKVVEEATYRLGDTYFFQKRYRKAEKFYKKALEKYPKVSKKYPNALFNIAESYFVLAEYINSFEFFKKFFENNKAHSYSGYALTRIGEILDILGYDSKISRGFYNESFFRYRKTTGGSIARMRILSQRFKDMKKIEIEDAIKEINKIKKRIDLSYIDEFSSFIISDGFYYKKQFMKAAQTLIDYFQLNPKPTDIDKFEKRISRSVTQSILKDLKKEDIIKAMSTIESYQESWLSKSKRVDVEYLKGLSLQKMGLYAKALKVYQKLEKRIKNIQGTREEKERKVFEDYPSMSSIYLRKGISYYHIKNNKKALYFLKKIKDISNLKDTSEYYIALSKIYFEDKNYKKALNFINKVNQEKITDFKKKNDLQYYISKIYEKNKNYSKSISITENLYKKAQNKEKKFYFLSRLFQLYREKKSKKSIEIGERLIKNYGKSYSLNKERYQLGLLYYEFKKFKKSKKIWKDLPKNLVWNQLAQNKINGETWKKEIEGSVKKIPALNE